MTRTFKCGISSCGALTVIDIVKTMRGSTVTCSRCGKVWLPINVKSSCCSFCIKFTSVEEDFSLQPIVKVQSFNKKRKR